MTARLECGDCRDVLFDLACAGEQFDACVTDPPYHLTSTVDRFGKPGAAPAQHGTDGLYARASIGFMGKAWDGGDIAFRPETWRLVLDVLKPGAHLLAFGGTRTFHRVAVAIEDAGFEIRDCIMWVYGTGFPKSHDVSKGIYKALGAERVASGRRTNGIASGTGEFTAGNDGSAGYRGEFDTYDDPATAAAAAWRGWGTALKPAWEPIIVARKSLLGTVAANVLANGCGALNIDTCRIHAPDALGGAYVIKRRKSGTEQNATGGSYRAEDAVDFHGEAKPGRWPANVIHDGSDEVEAAFAAFGDRGAAAPVRGTEPSEASTGRVTGRRARVPGVFHGDSGNASRFFYSAKASAADRAGSKHPTVKPLALMRYLCNLVTPPGGTVLDPFAGSGTTLQAAAECGFGAVGIEREVEYQADIRARLAALDAEAEAMFA